MATLKQILKKYGFAYKSSSSRREWWSLRQDRKWIGKSKVGLTINYYARKPVEVQVNIGSRKASIWFGYRPDSCVAESPTTEQLERFESLVVECRNAAINEEATPPEPKAPRSAPNKGTKISDLEKFNNRVWRWLGEFYVCGFIGKDMRPGLYYKKAGKHIRVADPDKIMAYANITEKHLVSSGLPFTLATFEDWLIDQGVKRRANKRIKRSFSLYD